MNLRSLYVLALLGLAYGLQAQEQPPAPPTPDPGPPVQTVQVPVTVAEQRPQYPGGDAGLSKALVAHLKYPNAALEAGLQGTVYVQYVVGVDGVIRDVVAVKKVHPLLDNAAVNAVKALPPYTKPAMNGGQPVPFQLVLPVRFKPE
jgi:protein TonB